MNPTVTSAADLIEDRIRTDAPLYGMETASDLLQRLNRGLVGDGRTLRFPPSKQKQIIDEETGAMWEPMQLDDADWYLGQLTIEEKHVPQYFLDSTVDETQVALIPDMFIADELIVSKRAKDLISEFAPEMCYFTPTKIIGKSSGKDVVSNYFKVMIRTCLYYDGPRPKHTIKPQGAQRALVRPATWTSYCRNPKVQDATNAFPIFLFGGASKYPILSAGLLKHLKAAKVSGLLEGTDHWAAKPERPFAYQGFETIFPLDPDYRK